MRRWRCLRLTCNGCPSRGRRQTVRSAPDLAAQTVVVPADVPADAGPSIGPRQCYEYGGSLGMLRVVHLRAAGDTSEGTALWVSGGMTVASINFAVLSAASGAVGARRAAVLLQRPQPQPIAGRRIRRLSKSTGRGDLVRKHRGEYRDSLGAPGLHRWYCRSPARTSRTRLAAAFQSPTCRRVAGADPPRRTSRRAWADSDRIDPRPTRRRVRPPLRLAFPSGIGHQQRP